MDLFVEVGVVLCAAQDRCMTVLERTCVWLVMSHVEGKGQFLSISVWNRCVQCLPMLTFWWHGKKFQPSQTLTRDFFPVATPMILFRGLGTRQSNKWRKQASNMFCLLEGDRALQQGQSKCRNWPSCYVASSRQNLSRTQTEQVGIDRVDQPGLFCPKNLVRSDSRVVCNNVWVMCRRHC